jgi:hypothetical protein
MYKLNNSLGVVDSLFYSSKNNSETIYKRIDLQPGFFILVRIGDKVNTRLDIF